MDLRPSARQQELIDRAYTLASQQFAQRAPRHDREASFPFEDYADLHAADPAAAALAHPVVAVHLDACGPCAEDLAGLLAAVLEP